MVLTFFSFCYILRESRREFSYSYYSYPGGGGAWSASLKILSAHQVNISGSIEFDGSNRASIIVLCIVVGVVLG
jgi:hypothetical protein